MSLPLVLVVDDEEPLLEILTYVVTDAGYAVVPAPHGRRALELAVEEWPALLVTDLMMPYLDGARLIAALRAEADAKGMPPLPAVLVTGAGAAAAAAAGADVVLRKPFELSEVEAVLCRFLGPPVAAVDTD